MWCGEWRAESCRTVPCRLPDAPAHTLNTLTINSNQDGDDQSTTHLDIWCTALRGTNIPGSLQYLQGWCSIAILTKQIREWNFNDAYIIKETILGSIGSNTKWAALWWENCSNVNNLHESSIGFISNSYIVISTCLPSRPFWQNSSIELNIDSGSHRESHSSI